MVKPAKSRVAACQGREQLRRSVLRAVLRQNQLEREAACRQTRDQLVQGLREDSRLVEDRNDDRELRHAQPPYRDNPSSFIVADDCATLCRLQHGRWEGIVDLNDRGAARSFLNRFDEAWLASATDTPALQRRG